PDPPHHNEVLTNFGYVGNTIGSGRTAIGLQATIPQPAAAEILPRRGPSFGSARAVVVALLTGRLRRQYDSDVRKFGDVHDATIQVAAGYICLAAALAQTIGLLTVLTVNPAHIEAHILAAISIAGCCHGFRHIRRRQDPGPVMEWLVLLHLVIVAIISFRHAGIVAPFVASLPAAAVIAALFMRPRMRLIALGLGLAVALAVVAFASGVAGVRSPYSEQTQSVMGVLTLGLSTIALGGIAWLTNLSRDFALERLGEANAKI